MTMAMGQTDGEILLQIDKGIDWQTICAAIGAQY